MNQTVDRENKNSMQLIEHCITGSDRTLKEVSDTDAARETGSYSYSTNYFRVSSSCLRYASNPTDQSLNAWLDH
jgi:hypothetical protein